VTDPRTGRTVAELIGAAADEDAQARAASWLTEHDLYKDDKSILDQTVPEGSKAAFLQHMSAPPTTPE
jgi:hypothetical protein